MNRARKMIMTKIRATVNKIHASERLKPDPDFILAFNDSIAHIDGYFYDDAITESEAKELYTYARLICKKYIEMEG